MAVDQLDRAILRLLLTRPRDGMREYARLLGVARGTVQSRMARLLADGVVADQAPRLDLAALGYPVLAFVHLQLAQGSLDSVPVALARIPEVLEVHSVSGEGDMLCRVAARSNPHLEVIVQSIIAVPGVVRTRTDVALRTRLDYRTLPLVSRHE
jgi:DNA-binding Lrp family transcriptional regulator